MGNWCGTSARAAAAVVPQTENQLRLGSQAQNEQGRMDQIVPSPAAAQHQKGFRQVKSGHGAVPSSSSPHQHKHLQPPSTGPASKSASSHLHLHHAKMHKLPSFSSSLQGAVGSQCNMLSREVSCEVNPNPNSTMLLTDSSDYNGPALIDVPTMVRRMQRGLENGTLPAVVERIRAEPGTEVEGELQGEFLEPPVGKGGSAENSTASNAQAKKSSSHTSSGELFLQQGDHAIVGSVGREEQAQVAHEYDPHPLALPVPDFDLLQRSIERCVSKDVALTRRTLECDHAGTGGLSQSQEDSSWGAGVEGEAGGRDEIIGIPDNRGDAAAGSGEESVNLLAADIAVDETPSTLEAPAILVACYEGAIRNAAGAVSRGFHRDEDFQFHSSSDNGKEGNNKTSASTTVLTACYATAVQRAMLNDRAGPSPSKVEVNLTNVNEILRGCYAEAARRVDCPGSNGGVGALHA